VPAVSGRTLIAYDLRILWNGASAAFGGARDRLLLLLAAPLLLLMAIEAAAGASATLGDMPGPARMLFAMLAAFAASLAIGRRLASLREESVVAAAALRRDAAAAYATFWNLPPAAAAMAVLLGGTGTFGVAASLAPPLLLSYGFGMVSASAARRARAGLRDRLQRRRAAQGGVRRLRLGAAGRSARIADLLASRAGLPRLPLAANLIAFAAMGALACAGHAVLRVPGGEGGAAAFAAFALLLLFVLLLREQAMLLRYLLFLGVGPAGPALVPLALAASFATGAVAAAAVAGSGRIGELGHAAAALLILFAAAALLRGLHHATKPRRAADFAIQIDFAAFLVAGIVVPWLAPPLLAGRLFLLHRHASALRHIAP